MNNFWMDGPIWMKFSELCRLVAANLVVGSTSAHSPPVRYGPAYSPFSWSLSPLLSWVLQGCVIPFWKAFDQANHNVRADFWFWTYTCTVVLYRWGLQGGCNIFANCPMIWNYFIGPPAKATRNASPAWLLVLMGHVIPFWKAFDVPNKHVRADFFILGLGLF